MVMCFRLHLTHKYTSLRVQFYIEYQYKTVPGQLPLNSKLAEQYMKNQLS